MTGTIAAGLSQDFLYVYIQEGTHRWFWSPDEQAPNEGAVTVFFFAFFVDFFFKFGAVRGRPKGR